MKILHRLIYAIVLTILVPGGLFAAFIEIIIRGYITIFGFPIWWILTGKTFSLLTNKEHDMWTNIICTKIIKLVEINDKQS